MNIFSSAERDVPKYQNIGFLFLAARSARLHVRTFPHTAGCAKGAVPRRRRFFSRSTAQAPRSAATTRATFSSYFFSHPCPKYRSLLLRCQLIIMFFFSDGFVLTLCFWWLWRWRQDLKVVVVILLIVPLAAGRSTPPVRYASVPVTPKMLADSTYFHPVTDINFALL